MSRDKQSDIERGDRLLEAGALDEAEALYQAALASDPKSVDAMYSIGCVASHRQDFDTSLRWARLALTDNPEHAGALALAGVSLFGLERYAESLQYLKASEKAVPSDVISVQIALCYEALGELEASEALLRAALEQDVAYRTRYAKVAVYSSELMWADIHAILARVLQREGDVEEARLHYHLARRIDPLVELDPMYLDIMSAEELEDHPLDRTRADHWADELDLSAFGESADNLRRIIVLAGRGICDADITELTAFDGDTLMEPTRMLLWRAQTDGMFRFAADIRIVFDCLNHEDVTDLLAAVRSSAWARLFELAELLHEGRWAEYDALSAAALESPSAPGLLVRFTKRFVAVDPPSAIALARVVEAALQGGQDGSAALESAILVGDAYAEAGDLSLAEAAFEVAVERADATAHDDLLVRALRRLGITQGKRGRAEQSVETLTRLIDEAERASDPETAQNGRHNLAVTLGNAGRWQEAYQAALETAFRARQYAGGELGPDLADMLRWAAAGAGRDLPPDLLVAPPAETENSVADLHKAAVRLSESGRPEEALACLDEAIDTARDDGTPGRILGPILHLRGRVLADIGRREEARAVLEDAVKAFPHGDSPRLLNAYKDLGRILAETGHVDEAVKGLETALMHARRARSGVDEVEIRQLLAGLLQDSDPDLATYHSEKASRLRAPRSADGGARQRFAELAELSASDPDRALTAMIDELALVDHPAERRDITLTVGRAALDAEQFDLAERSLLEAVELSISPGCRDAESELDSRQALATVYRLTGRYHEAISQYRLALGLAERMRDDMETAMVRGRLGIALRYVDQLDNAVSEYQLALATFRRYDSWYHIGVTQMNLTSTLFLLGRTDEAITAAAEALRLFDQYQQQDMAARTLAMVAMHTTAADLPTGLALRLRTEALHSDDHMIRAWSATDKAELLLAEDDVSGAEQELAHAIEIFRSSKDIFNEAVSQLHRARLLYHVDPDTAWAAAEASRVIALKLDQRQLAVAAQAVLLQIALDKCDDDAISQLLRSLTTAWAERRQALRKDRDRIALADAAVPLLKRTADYYRGEARFDRAFEVLDLARAQGLTDALTVRAEPLARTEGLTSRLRGLLRALPGPAVALTLDIVGGRVLLGSFRADQQEPDMTDTGILEVELTSMLENFRTEMLTYRGHGPQTWQAAMQRLLAQASGKIRDDDLVLLVPDGPLQQLPLHVDVLAAGDAVFYAPSFLALELSRKRPQSPDEPFGRLVSVGVSFPDEARAVGAALGGSALTGRGLDKSVVKDMVSNATIIHFACHGYFDTADFLDSGLLLSTTETPSRGEVLSLRDLMDWRLQADLVVLSACETGLGKVVPSDFLSLGRGILAAGAHAVIVTLWPVEDAATQRLMLEFYQTMAGHRDKTGRINVARALSATQRHLAAIHPLYDWAAFKLIGWPLIEWSTSP
jgi:tetratricopeptide (TPR) repeat protein